MNVLFVNYGDFTSNSLNHIAAFAAGLSARGHVSIVAVPRRLDTLHVVHQPRFQAALFSDLLERDLRFPDGRHADIVHAWTPRECVRRFVLAYQHRAHARVIVHLEDNEDHLFAARHGLDRDTLLDLPESQLAAVADEVLTHPRRARQFMRVCDGATVIVPTLAEKLPPSVPHITLFPGLEPSLFDQLPTRAEARRFLGLDDTATIVAYPGSSNFANEGEMRELYAAVALLNDRGTPVTLLRTGHDSDVFATSIHPDHQRHVLHLGFIDKSRIPHVLAAADILVQPGDPGPYNNLRLPSKLPEFLAAGRPVILPASNLGTVLRDRIDAWIVPDGRPETLAAACQAILGDPTLAARLAENGAAFARAHFDLRNQCGLLETFYNRTLETKARPGSLCAIDADESDLSLSLKALREKLRALPASDDAVAHASEIIPLVEHLERPDAMVLERDRAERDRDAWRGRFDDVRTHLHNVEAQLAASTQHLENLHDQHADSLRHLEHLRLQHADSLRHLEHLRLQHAESLQHLEHLEQQRAASETHVRNLDATITGLRGEIDAGLQRQQVLETSVAEARRMIAELQAANLSLESARDTALAQVTQLSERAARLSFSIHELKHELMRRNGKIQTLETSFSWRITRPLRWLRRKLIDPRRRHPAAHASTVSLGEIAPPAPPCSPPGLYGLPHSVDEPRSWTLAPRQHLLRGWVFHPDGNELRGIRAVVGTRTIDGVYGFKRLDVAASVRGHPQAEFCGWRIEADLGETDTMLEIQVLEESGIWLPFFRTGLRVGNDLGPTDLSRYEEWIRVYDTLSPETLRAQRERATLMPSPPRFSVLMPVYNTPERWLRRAIESVRGQSYPHWELCVADDASTEPHVRRILDEAAAGDARVRVVHRATNGHISAASNSALELATGDFVALLDHDDELAPQALFEVAIALGRTPDADLVYSDEDKIDEDGRRFEPYFKPDWNPDLFLGQNYLSHLSVYRTSLVREVGGFRVGFEGRQDWDLALRVTDRIPASHIAHVPRVLYHWRAIAGSTALQLSEKSYPVEAARRALVDHFSRKSAAARLEPVPGDHWRVVHPLPEPAPLVSS